MQYRKKSLRQDRDNISSPIINSMSITHPIVLAIIAGALSYVLMLYLCKEDDNKKKSRKGKSKSKKKGTNEMVIIVPGIVALGTWFLASYYLTDNKETNPASVGSDSDSLLDLNNIHVPGKGVPVGSMQQNNNPAMATIQKGGKIPHISSDDPTRSYNLIGSGLNIPRSELKIPSVLIDYQ